MSVTQQYTVNNILQNTKILEEYRDRCYVNNVLCQKSCDFYGKIKLLISIPLILLSSLMTILNSSELNSTEIDYNFQKGIKVLNIILNAFTVVLISLTNTLKISEKQSNFRNLAIKYNKLCHVIEDNLIYSVDNISHKSIFELITEYDNLNEALEYSFPEHIKNRVKAIYKNKRTLPNILNCETDFVGSCKKMNIVEKYKHVHHSNHPDDKKHPEKDVYNIKKDVHNSFRISENEMKEWKKRDLKDNFSDTSPSMFPCESPFVKHFKKHAITRALSSEDDIIIQTKYLENSPPYQYTISKSDSHNVKINGSPTTTHETPPLSKTISDIIPNPQVISESPPLPKILSESPPKNNNFT